MSNIAPSNLRCRFSWFIFCVSCMVGMLVFSGPAARATRTLDEGHNGNVAVVARWAHKSTWAYRVLGVFKSAWSRVSPLSKRARVAWQGGLFVSLENASTCVSEHEIQRFSDNLWVWTCSHLVFTLLNFRVVFRRNLSGLCESSFCTYNPTLTGMHLVDWSTLCKLMYTSMQVYTHILS